MLWGPILAARRNLGSHQVPNTGLVIYRDFIQNFFFDKTEYTCKFSTNTTHKIRKKNTPKWSGG